MSYDLDQFVSDCRAILARDAGPNGREEVRVQLEHLLADQDFIRQYCGDDAPRGLKLLYEDKELPGHRHPRYDGLPRLPDPRPHQ